MRIALLTTEFATEPSFAGGLAQYLGRLSAALAQRGHAVEVFVLGDDSRTLRTDRGLLVHRVRPVDLSLGGHNLLDIAEYYMARKRLPMCLRTSKSLRGMWSLCRRFRQRAARRGFDIVQASNFRAPGLLLQLTPPVPIVVRLSSYAPLLHAWWDTPDTLDNRAVAALEGLSLRRAQSVYAPSRFLAGHVSRTTGLSVRHLLPPFEISGESEDPAVVERLADWPKYLLFFGRLTAYKGARVLREAIEPLLEKDPAFRLVLAGPVLGGQGRKLVALAEKYPQQVRSLGVLPQEQLRPVIREAWAVALPSLVDNLPNTCLEAMALGAVVLGPSGASFDEIIRDGHDGLLFEHGSADALRKLIREAWVLPAARRNEISQAARKVCDRFDTNTAVSSLLEYYQRVITEFRNATL